MKLEEFEDIYQKSSPERWEKGEPMPFSGGVMGYSLHGPERYHGEWFMEKDVDFIVAAHEMVPRMIKALKTMQRVTKSIDKVMATVGEEIIVMVNDIEFKIDFTSELKQALAELEQP